MASAARWYLEEDKKSSCAKPTSHAGFDSGRVHDVPRRDLADPAKLGREGVAQRHLFQRGGYFNEVDKGGHFAAWEEPVLFTTEIRAAFKSQRNRATP